MPKTYLIPIRMYEVTHVATGVPYDISAVTTSCTVTQRENAIDTANLTFADETAYYYLDKITSGDILKVYWDFADRPGASDPPTKLRFWGIIDEVSHSLGGEGIFVNISARQSGGRALLNMLCGEEYGTESSNPTINGLQGIITDLGVGIIDEWVNHLNHTAVETYYNLQWDVLAYADEIKYVYFPHKPARDCINDLLDIEQAIKGATAGPHWICYHNGTDPILILDQIGTHTVNPVDWPAYWNTEAMSANANAAQFDVTVTNASRFTANDNVMIGDALANEAANHINSIVGNVLTMHNALANNYTTANHGYVTTLTGCILKQGVDFATHTFEKTPVKANYVLYYGKFQKPLNESATNSTWTEEIGATGGHNLWDAESADITVTSDAGAGNFKVGANGIKFALNAAGGVTGIAHTLNGASSWEISKWGGIYNIPTLNFWSKYTQSTAGGQFFICLFSGADYAEWTLIPEMSDGAWRQFSLPLGIYWQTKMKTAQTRGWSFSGGWTDASWNDIDYVKVVLTAPLADVLWCFIDGMYFDGWIKRGVRQTAVYSDIDPCKQLIITDDVAKDDSGITTDTTGTIARLAYAHLLREKSTPIQGTICIPAQPDMMAGQIIPIQAAKYGATDYRIAVDMRIQQVSHVFADRFLSYVTLTSDIKNAIPLPPKDAYNLLMDTVKPEFQTRQSSSTKARDVDITQEIMENDEADF